jgi:hypothetical protein
MFLNYIKNGFPPLIFFIVAGCGLSTPAGGHDPNKPLPVYVSDKAAVLVYAGIGAIITIPDGKATLSISQTALRANTSFEIAPYNLSQGSPRISVDQMYSLTPVTVSTLIAQQVLNVTIRYDPTLIPNGIPETDLRLGVFDPINGCWSHVFLDSPPVLPGHQVNSKDLTQLGIFGVTTINTPICNSAPLTF